MLRHHRYDALVKASRLAAALALTLTFGERTPASAQTMLGANPAAACTELTGASVSASAIGIASGAARIEQAVFVPAQPLQVAEKAPTPAGRISPAIPDSCKLLGAIDPIDPTAPPIKFQINLPAQWNGRAVQYGGGGFNGTVVTGLALVPAARFDKPAPLAQGYVTYGTDSGHGTAPAIQAFALNDEAFANFAHASYKKVRDVMAALVKRAYGRPPDKVYYFGSSEGGREGMTMAQRYPADYDGIFARVPVINWTGLIHASARNGLVTMGDAWLDAPQVKLVADAVLAACDAEDGTTDGIVSDPMSCRTKFDPTKLACSAGQATSQCLNAAQVKAVQTLHAPYKFSFALANGMTEYPGWGVSGENTAAYGPTGGWRAWWLGTSAPATPPVQSNGIVWFFGSGAMRYVFARDPNFEVMAYKPEMFAERVKAVSELMDSTNPDLSAFKARGGKLIMLEHMADYAQSPYAGINYYESVVKKFGKGDADGFIRLYTAPGVDHVGSGAPANVDMLSALTDWVEKGKAPTGLELAEQALEPPFAVTRARPLCEWPAWPRFKSGDVAHAASFECRP